MHNTGLTRTQGNADRLLEASERFRARGPCFVIGLRLRRLTRNG